jgi:hypothetical protein
VPDEGCNQRSSEESKERAQSSRSPRRAHHDALSHFPLRSVLTDALARPAPEPSMAGMPLDHEEEQNTKWESH